MDKGTAQRLEQRITAWADSRKAEGRCGGITAAARKVKFFVAGIKCANACAAAEKVL